jgi:hypothetical protein
MADIHYGLLRSLSDIQKGLAGTPIKNLRAIVESPLVEAIAASRTEADIAGVAYPTSLLDELQVEGGAYGSYRVTPAGARYLIDLYERDLLPRKVGAGEKNVDPAIQAYADSEAVLIAKTKELEAKERMRDEKHKGFVENPANIPESEFEYPLLNDVFFKHMGPGSGTMLIGGIEVTKSLASFSSNSGKTSEWSVRFTWRSADGEPKLINESSRYAGNRRNDAERNWGLGRE